MIDNALKHGRTSLSAIKVEMAIDENMAHVTVSDDGKGLSPDLSDVAFCRISQIEPSNGSVLGLTIAVSVAERHNGKLTINCADLGASLTMSLPHIV